MSKSAFLYAISRAPGSHRERFVIAASALAVVAAVFFCSLGRYFEATGAAAIAFSSSLLLAGRIPIEAILIFWFAATPVLSYFIRLPIEKSIITFDRAVIAGVSLMLFLQWEVRD